MKNEPTLHKLTERRLYGIARAFGEPLRVPEIGALDFVTRSGRSSSPRRPAPSAPTRPASPARPALAGRGRRTLYRRINLLIEELMQARGRLRQAARLLP